MKIAENDAFPKVTFFKMSASGPISVKSQELLENKKVLLIGVPGAFTPTCNDEHLPGYIELAGKFLQKGIDNIICISNNDPFVVQSWSDNFKSNDIIEFISDGNGEFRDCSGLEVDLSVVGLGKRLSRFAILIENEVIKKIFNENGPGLDISKAENVIKQV